MSDTAQVASPAVAPPSFLHAASPFTLPSPTFLTAKEVCKRWGISSSTLRRAVRKGNAPAPVSIVGGRRMGWRESDIIAHEQKRAGNT